jgi:hypothetical protein
MNNRLIEEVNKEVIPVYSANIMPKKVSKSGFWNRFPKESHLNFSLFTFHSSLFTNCPCVAGISILSGERMTINAKILVICGKGGLPAASFLNKSQNLRKPLAIPRGGLYNRVD